MPNNKVKMARLVRRDEMDRSFDVEFWQQVGPEGIWAAMWKMVQEADLLRGGYGSQPRLQRSITSFKRRKR